MVMHDISKLLEWNCHEVDLWWTTEKTISQTIYSIFNLKYYFKLRNVLNNKSYDIIHIHKFNSILSSSIFLSLIMKKSKKIIHIHDFSFYCYKLWITTNNTECNWWVFHRNCKSYKYRRIEFLHNFIKWIRFHINRFFIKRCIDYYICPSMKLKNLMIRSLKLNPNKVIYLPNYINIPINDRLDYWTTLPTYLLFVGRISYEKWLEVAINAINHIIKNKLVTWIQFNIIGDWPDRLKIEKLIHEYWLENHIKILWKIDNSHLSKYYQQAWIVLMPSIWLENNPLVALEAMKHGRPIIASNVGWFPDLIEDGKNWYLFKTGNHMDLAENILHLLWNKEMIIKMWTFWFEKAKREFNSNLFYEGLMKVYNS